MSSQETPGASESADVSSHLRRCEIRVSACSQGVAELMALPSFRCGQACADSGRNTTAHRVTRLFWSFAGLCLGNLPRIHSPDLQLSPKWLSRWSPGDDGDGDRGGGVGER